jgi:hypothetical protein
MMAATGQPSAQQFGGLTMSNNSLETTTAAAHDKYLDADYQRACDQLVHNEIYCCLSGMVAELQRLGPDDDDVMELGYVDIGESERAEAISDGGYTIMQRLDDSWYWGVNGLFSHDEYAGPFNTADEAAQDCIDSENLDPAEYQREVFEHWAVSNWLAEKLIANGETVRDFGGLNIWLRTTTGQAISIDRVICDIYDQGQAWLAELQRSD